MADGVIRGLTLINPAFWCVLLGGRRFRVSGVTIRSPGWLGAPNTDGIDVAAEGVHIEHCDIRNGGDSIAIKSPSADVLVEHTVARQGNGLVVGAAGSGLPGEDQTLHSVRNVTFRHCVAVDTTFGCHIKARPPQHGVARGVLFENITVTQAANATARRVRYGDHQGHVLGIHLFDQSTISRTGGALPVDAPPDLSLSSPLGRGPRRPPQDSVGRGAATVSAFNVTFRDIVATALFAGEFRCTEPGAPAAGCKEIVLENVRLNASAPVGAGCTFTGGLRSGQAGHPAALRGHPIRCGEGPPW